MSSWNKHDILNKLNEMNSQANLTFEEDQHVYIRGGKAMKSTTTHMREVFDKYRSDREVKRGFSYFFFKSKEEMGRGYPYYDAMYEKYNGNLNMTSMSVEDYISFALHKYSVIGTKFHKASERYDLDGTATWDGDMHSMMERYMDFLDVVEPDYVSLEQSLVPKEVGYGLAGTYDGLAIIDGELVLLDKKTTSKIDEKVFVQTAIYAYMLSTWGIRVDKIAVIQIKRDGGSWNYIEKDFDDHYYNIGEMMIKDHTQIEDWLVKKELIKGKF